MDQYILDVNKYNEKYPYGSLSGRNIEDALEGTRALDGQSEKEKFSRFRYLEESKS